jgi:Uma2 family endonuclease
MSIRSRVRTPLTLEEFLELADIDEHPAREYIDDPERRIVEVFRADGSRTRIADDGALEGEPVLPGYTSSVATVFGWLKLRVIRPRGEEQAGSGGPTS